MDTTEVSSSFGSEFTLSEIVDMENLYKELGQHSLNKDFCQTVATTFSCSVSRSGKSPITWKQVYCWFKDKELGEEAKPAAPPASPPASPQASQLSTLPTSLPGHVPVSPPASPASQFHYDLPNLSFSRSAAYGQKRKGNVSDVSELAFEARSARDDAWYDVASFLTQRVLHTGELEVRVRFSSFDKEDDEWVNVRTSVRERSIPLEPSDCQKVKVGDMVLCFQEREDQAIYFDANVVDIRRGSHDMKSCTCLFLVHYDHDASEEMVGLDRICCRPAEECSLQSALP